ncbi:ATP-binding protein [Floricoccus penangensis]|uniref:ATP-binding protein n=1 Tax=Floricoccus penangensis TaxID=1859475 RepID=UPI00203E9572|nr:ATP-binding protein [Floricoccus penangensis]URZ87568.1 ATP-binding protein [Floricoccus penangensis]
MGEQLMVAKGKFGINSRLIPGILGSEIIESYGIAIAEQIKNSADAGSKGAIIDLSSIDEDIITITDTGEGMTKKNILEDWFKVATDNKSYETSLSGGKGIGRFSLFKLGKELKIETFSDEGKYSFSISEEQILNSNLEDLSIPIMEGSSLTEKGTRIIISKLDEQIDLNEIELDLENLIEIDNDFNMKVLYPKGFEHIDFLKPDEAILYAPFSAHITINFDSIDYNFETKLDKSTVYSNDEICSNFFKQIKGLFDTNEIFLELGPIDFYLYNFYFDKKKHIKDYLYDNNMETRIPKQFLSAYQGINIYRNGFKIYGHGKTDWLKLAELRVSRSAENIDNKQSYGIIMLNNDKSYKLREKSSREGFIKDKSSNSFSKLITILVRQFGLDRKNSINIIRDHIEKANPSVPIPKENRISPRNFEKSSSSSDEKSNTRLIGTSSSHNEPNLGEEKNDTNLHDSKKQKSKKSPEQTRYNITRNNKLTQIDQSIFDGLRLGKIRDLICELTQIDTLKYPYSTAYIFRALLENLMNEYIIANFDEINSHFPNYIVENDKVFKKIEQSNSTSKKDISNRNKILDFKKYLQGKSFDSRELRTLDKLAGFIDDLNLAMHWNNKMVLTSDLYALWNNSKFFIEFLCKGL